MLQTKTVEAWLGETDYKPTAGYVPSDFALKFVNFIKLVNGKEGDQNITPVLHYKMLDNVAGRKRNIANMLFRGSGKALDTATPIPTPEGFKLLKDLVVGDTVFDRIGNATKITFKSEVFDKPTYQITLNDKRSLIVSEDHINIVQKITTGGVFKELNLTVPEILKEGLFYRRTVTKKQTTGKENKWYIPSGSTINYDTKEFPLDPYTVGVILGDGSIDKISGYTRIHSHINDVDELISYIPYPTSTRRYDKRNPNAVRFSLPKLGSKVKKYVGLGGVKDKRIPTVLVFGDTTQRVEVLRGLMDTDGTVSKSKGYNPSFSSTSFELAYGVATLVRSLGGRAVLNERTQTEHHSYRVSIQIGICPFKLKRKADLWKAKHIKRIPIVAIKRVPNTPTQCIAVESATKSFMAADYITTHNTTVFAEMLFLYLAVFGEIPDFGEVNLALYVSDSIDHGVRNMRRNLEYRRSRSDFMMEYVPHIRFTDARWEFTNIDGKTLIVKGYGAKALSLDTKVIMLDGSQKAIKDVQIGDYIFTPQSYQTKVTGKSEVFHRPMYKITLEDGRSWKVCEEHLNSVTLKLNPNNKAVYRDLVLSTEELLQLDLQHTRIRKRKGKPDYTSHENLIFIKNTKAVQYFPQKYNLDPYTLGLLIGDGSLKKDGSCMLHCHKDDFNEYVLSLPDNLGDPYLDKRNNTVISIAIKGISQIIRDLKLNVHGNDKFIPEKYLIGSIDQRIALLRGLMDTDGTIYKNGRMGFSSNSLQLIEDVSSLVRSLGGTAKQHKNTTGYRIEIWIDINPFNLPRKANRYNNKVKPLVAIQSIERIPDEPSQCIQVADPNHEFLVEDYIRTHNTGVRGEKEMGQRPVLCVLDDIVSDADAKSDTIIDSIEDTVYNAVNYALHPTRSKIIWNGTPFNSKDPLYKAVESGAWHVNVFPICEEFPCEQGDFRGAWEDRFPYSYVKEEYDRSVSLGKVANFNQELMLRIMSEEERLIQDNDIRWYKRASILQYKERFNFYITTDFATTEKTSGDFSVISVWALNNKFDWFWVDGIVKKQLMNDNIDDLFRLAHDYNPQEVGIEVSGQQGGFISWIQDEMLRRNNYFALASEGNDHKPGIRPNTNKMQRFNIVVPWFKTGKVYFPEEMRQSPEMQEAYMELSLVSPAGFKSKHDDFIDTISQLASLRTWAPSSEAEFTEHNSKSNESRIWAMDEDPVDNERYSSYIV